MAGEQLVAVVNPDGSLVGGGGGTSNVAVTNFPATQAVSGTVTALPSGTQAVSGTVTTVPSGTQNVNVTSPNPLPVVVTTGNTFTGFYSFSISNMPGVVAANNFVTLMNETGSGKTLQVFSATVGSWISGGATSATSTSMICQQIISSSGGTLQNQAAIARLDRTMPAPTGAVRTANPSVLFAAEIISFPPPIGVDTGNSLNRIVSTQDSGVVLHPGEGIRFFTTVGSVNQFWNVAFSWGEI